jgi:hypothetical protein
MCWSNTLHIPTFESHNFGPWALDGYAGSTVVPYDLQITAWPGTAIRHTGSDATPCRQESICKERDHAGDL